MNETKLEVRQEELQIRWRKHEQKILPLIESSAKKFKRKTAGFLNIDLEDAIQEGRIALFEKLIKFDADKGELENFVRVTLNNHYADLIYKTLRQKRMPRKNVYRDGQWEETIAPPLLFGSEEEVFLGASTGIESILSKVETPAEALERKEVEALVKVFNLKLINKLKGRDKTVYECLTNPPVELLKMIQNTGGNINEVTHINIARFLGLNRNTVYWSMHRIRTTFTELSRQKDFSQLFANKVNDNSWPMIHVSRKPGSMDIDFVQQVIKERKLDPIPSDNYHLEPDFRQQVETYARQIERYQWGVVLVLRYGRFWRTIVIEGKFNSKTGVVVGSSGAREKLPVKWYSKLVKKLNGGV